MSFIIETSLVGKITFGFANGIALYPFILVSPGNRQKASLIRHEKIHLRQQFEMLVLFFYVVYVLEFLFRLWQYRNWDEAYQNISFEREAYRHQHDEHYLSKRRWFSWSNYWKD